MATFLAPPEAGVSAPVRLSRAQALIAREHYEKLTDKEFDEFYHDVMAEATRRNAERIK
jgi:hypothetical protein